MAARATAGVLRGTLIVALFIGSCGKDERKGRARSAAAPSAGSVEPEEPEPPPVPPEQMEAVRSDKYAPIGEPERFEEVRGTIRQSTQTMAHYGAVEAYEEIVRNLKRFREIRRKVAEAQNVDDVIDEITAGLEEMASGYEKIAALRDQVMKVHGVQLEVMGQLQSDSKDTVDDIVARRRAFLDRLDELEASLKTETDDIERRKLDVSLRSTRIQLKSLDAKEVIWNRFQVAQKKLLARLQVSSKKLGLLLHILQENAKVYRAAASVAKLRRSARYALRELAVLADMERLLGDLESSWTEVSSLVDEISKADFALGIEGEVQP